MSISSYPNGFPTGITIRGLPLNQVHPGVVHWVNSTSILPPSGTSGADGNKGTYQQPFATIEGALNSVRVVASRGDVIMVMPGYTETLTTAAQLLFDKAGVAIVGLGVGSLRPTLTFGAAAANIPITVANVSISNILFSSNFLNVASAFTATTTTTPTDFTVDGCEFRDSSATKGFKACVTGNATANSLDGFTFINNKRHQLDATAATTCVSVLAATSHVTMAHNQVVSPALNDTAALATLAANACLDLHIYGNRVWRPSTSSTGGTLFSGSGVCTGLVYDNYVWHLDNSAGLLATTGQTLGFFENYCPVTSAADKSALINPVAV